MKLTLIVLLCFGYTQAAELTSCQCGQENTKDRIVGGVESKANRYPWMVALTHPSGARYQFCGGSIISDRYILTAAHCLHQQSLSDVAVAVGAHSLADTPNSQVIRAKRLINHPGYDHSMTLNDVGIIELAEPLKFSDKIQPICLPETDLTSFSNLYVTGWGKLGRFIGSSNVLREVAVPAIDEKICRTKIYFDRRLEGNIICAGASGTDSCNGDSGGPLITRKSGTNFIVGLVSFGSVDCGDGAPGIYTRVTQHLPWIKQQIAAGNTCAKPKVF